MQTRTAGFPRGLMFERTWIERTEPQPTTMEPIMKSSKCFQYTKTMRALRGSPSGHMSLRPAWLVAAGMALAAIAPASQAAAVVSHWTDLVPEKRTP
jgi:hypothetical protein